MTKKRDLKDLARARAAETGESYQTALRHVLAKRASDPPSTRVPVAAIDDDGEAYRFVADSMDYLDDKLYRERGTGVHEDADVVAMIDEMVKEGALSARAGEYVKTRVPWIVADHDWMVTTGNIDDLEAIKDYYG